MCALAEINSPAHDRSDQHDLTMSAAHMRAAMAMHVVPFRGIFSVVEAILFE